MTFDYSGRDKELSRVDEIQLDRGGDLRSPPLTSLTCQVLAPCWTHYCDSEHKYIRVSVISSSPEESFSHYPISTYANSTVNLNWQALLTGSRSRIGNV